MTVGFLFASPARALLGDVNCDGVVNATDAQVLANVLVGISTSVPCPQNADVNSDGQVNVADALLILQLSKGLRTSFSYQSTSVLAITPSSGTANILLGAEISAIFSNPVSSASLPGNFTVADAVSGQLSTGTFRCSQNGTISVFTPGVPFLPAHNYVVSLSTGITDNFGNPISTSVVVNFQTQPLGTMNLTSVNNSTATMNTLLSSPIAVQLFTSTGAPAVQVPIVFSAQMGNGTFQPSGLRQVTVLTDNNGNAVIAYKTGTQAMTNTVAVSAVGFSTVPAFQVQTMASSAVNLRVYTGVNQTGATGTVAPFPLVVQATDAGGDNIQGTTVTFSVSTGFGSFAGQVSSSVVTDSTGTAAVMFTFGASSGPAQVQASFPGMVGTPPLFNLTALSPLPSTSTYVAGNVIDSNTLLPLTSAYVYLTDNPSIWERTDQNGNFVLPASTGPHVVEVDGFESGLINGQMYPTVSYPVNAVQGQTTSLGIPAMLPVLDQQSYLDVSDILGGTLTIRSNPLWQLYVAPGQVTFQNGSHTGRIYATSVPHDKIPMPVAGGKVSRFDDTVQPPTVIFNPPAQVTFPNMDNLLPGTETDIFTLDYVSGAFKRTGRGLVSADATVIQSLPGQGITQGGWHSAPSPKPPPPGCRGGNYYFGNSCKQAVLSGYGTPANCSPISGYPGWNRCLLCGLPTNQGPTQPIATCVNASTAPVNPPPPPPPCPPGANCPQQPNVIAVTIAANLPALGPNQPDTITIDILTDPPVSVAGLPIYISNSNPAVATINTLVPATDPVTTTTLLTQSGGSTSVQATAAGTPSNSTTVTEVDVQLFAPSPTTLSLNSGSAATFTFAITPPTYVPKNFTLTVDGVATSITPSMASPGAYSFTTVEGTDVKGLGSHTVQISADTFASNSQSVQIIGRYSIYLNIPHFNEPETWTSAQSILNQRCSINGWITYKLVDNSTKQGIPGSCTETIVSDPVLANVAQGQTLPCLKALVGLSCAPEQTNGDGTFTDRQYATYTKDNMGNSVQCLNGQIAARKQTITCTPTNDPTQTATLTQEILLSPTNAAGVPGTGPANVQWIPQPADAP